MVPAACLQAPVHCFHPARGIPLLPILQGHEQGQGRVMVPQGWGAREHGGLGAKERWDGRGRARSHVWTSSSSSDHLQKSLQATQRAVSLLSRSPSPPAITAHGTGVSCVLTGYFSLDRDLPEGGNRGLLSSGAPGRLTNPRIGPSSCHYPPSPRGCGQGFLLSLGDSRTRTQFGGLSPISPSLNRHTAPVLVS